MSTFNGHESYEHWNVSLWLNNDEPMYRIMMEYVEDVVYGKITMDQAVQTIKALLPEQTQDGVEFTTATIKAVVSDHYDEMLQYS